jgi:hypothetical protein
MITSLLLLALAAPSEPPGSALQIDAPSINSASPELLDRAELPSRVGFAWDERLADTENRRAMTLSVTPLAAENLIRRRFDHDAASLWQRAALRVTLGGPPQFIDSLRTVGADRALNHVTSELKLQLLDHRATPGQSGELLLALALDADNLTTGYGLDRYGATLIAERQARCTWTANGGYRILERYQELHRLTETKLGLGTQWRLGPEWQRGALDFGISGACLLRNRGRPLVWQGGAIADFRAADGLRVSLGARQSDRPEIRGDGRVRDVLSLSYDF